MAPPKQSCNYSSQPVLKGHNQHLLPLAPHAHYIQGQDLAGFKGGPLAGCLCSKAMLDYIIGNVEGNALARAAGITRSMITSM